LSVERFRERVASLERRELVGMVAIAVLVVGAAAVWYLRSLPSTVQIQETGVRPRPAPAAAVSPSPSPAAIVVDVAGRVRHPGVYTMTEGDRVIDAIRRAGGALAGADLTSINLAALLTDAEQIVVGRAGGGGHASGTTTGSGTSSGSATSGSGGLTGKIDINTATLDQLETLPRIGEVLGQRIIDYREQHGPFRSIDDLLNVSGIGDATMAGLRPLVTI
jgi:competence protein ComEA